MEANISENINCNTEVKKSVIEYLNNNGVGEALETRYLNHIGGEVMNIREIEIIDSQEDNHYYVCLFTDNTVSTQKDSGNKIIINDYKFNFFTKQA